MPSTKQISEGWKLFHFTTGVLMTFFTVGIIFGWTPILTILQAEGQYQELCDGGDGCAAQSLKLNLIYTVSVSVFGVMFLPAGYFLDRVGPRASRLVGSALVLVGLVLFGVSDSKTFDAFIPGYLLIAVGAPSIFSSFFHWSSMFKRSELFLTMLNCALDAGPIIFFLFELIFFAGFERKTLFCWYIAVPALVFLHSAILKDPVNMGKGGKRKNRYARIYMKNLRLAGKGVPKIQEDFYTLPEQLRSIYYIMVTCTMVIVAIRINFYVGTVSEQLTHYNLSPKESELFTVLFNTVFPLGGLVFALPIGWLIQKFSIITSLFVALAIGIIFGMMTIVSNVYVQIATFILLSLFRPLVYSVLSTYVTIVFGFARFGTLYGIINIITGGFGFGQYFLTWLVYNKFHGSFFEVNMGLTFMTALTFVFPLVLKINKRINDSIGGNSYILLKDKIEKAIARNSMNGQIPTNEVYKLVMDSESAYRDSTETDSNAVDSDSSDDEEKEEKSTYIPPPIVQAPVASSNNAPISFSASKSTEGNHGSVIAGASFTDDDDSNPFASESTKDDAPLVQVLPKEEPFSTPAQQAAINTPEHSLSPTGDAVLTTATSDDTNNPFTKTQTEPNNNPFDGEDDTNPFL